LKYRLTAISDADPAWNLQIERWWNQGGALLWAQYGGVGSETLDLPEEEFASFLEKAKTIDGWEAFGESLELERSIAAVKPVSIRAIEDEKPEPELELDLEPESRIESPNYCCRNCGRPWHPGLQSVRDQELVKIPVRELNHVLNSLEEAINFGRGEGPNNSSTWQDALVGLVQVIGALETSRFP
jgi:hypothetical protein